MGRQDHRSSRMVARVDDHTRRPASPRGRERSEEVFFTTNRAGVPEPPVWLSCVAAVRTGPAVFAARPSGAVRLRGSGIEAGAGASRGARGWLPGGGVVYTLGRATVAVASVARQGYSRWSMETAGCRSGAAETCSTPAAQPEALGSP